MSEIRTHESHSRYDGMMFYFQLVSEDGHFDHWTMIREGKHRWEVYNHYQGEYRLLYKGMKIGQAVRAAQESL
ncbi:hypothetical protein [Mechercharimyces sp. CAU 1602]|uniref:hypothetical protein n=1 Tax=Mechercharimyces sp. CAU 1602 TaxID=2973933 RepID=UPI00216246CC|nr:hypothetical protein [Mechercharimyces sp. CAU 1602]MCS1351181.1 hypothetical protein [Mechercharimyces sp. CAU 1602]